MYFNPFRYFVIFMILFLFSAALSGCNGSGNGAGIVSGMTGVSLPQETEQETPEIVVVPKTAKEAFRLYLTIPETDFETRAKVHKTWILLAEREMQTATTAEQAVDLFYDVPPELQDSARMTWETLWRKNISEQTTCKGMFLAQEENRPWWVDPSEVVEFDRWREMAVNEIAAAKRCVELDELNRWLPQDATLAPIWSLAGWKLRLQEDLEVLKANEEIQKIILELSNMGAFNQKG